MLTEDVTQPVNQDLGEHDSAEAGATTAPTPLINWRADEYSGSPGSYVLGDLSGNGHDATQAAGTATPGTDGTSALMTMTGAQFNASGTIDARPVTVITVFTRSSGQATGLFGHSAASDRTRLWCGFETLDRHSLYMGNGSVFTGPVNSASTDHGSIQAYMSLASLGAGIVGYGGALQAAVSYPRGNPTTITPSLGAGFRQMTGVWRETRVYSGILTMAQQDAVAAELNSRYGLSIALWSSLTAIPAALLIGQSNTAGRAAMASLPVEYQGDQTDVFIWDGATWDTLNASSDNNNQLGESPNNRFGFEASIGKEYLDANGGQIYLMKWAKGGTALADTASAECWSHAPGTTTQNQFKYASIETFQAIQAMQAAGNRPDWKAICWFQGESDADTEAYANAYETNFDAFKPAMEAATLADPKWLSMRIADEGSGTYKSTVRTAQADIAAAYSDVTMIDTDDYSMLDLLHLDHTGQVELGTDLAALL